ncbi:MAG: hypothetical protein U1F68_07940 [Gammaproteobacteria bacterium]
MIVYGCGFGAPLGDLESPGVAVLEIPCIGNLLLGVPGFRDQPPPRRWRDARGMPVG